jgi:hypothetical protein
MGKNFMKKLNNYKIEMQVEENWEILCYTNDYFWDMIFNALKEQYWKEKLRVINDKKEIICEHEAIL